MSLGARVHSIDAIKDFRIYLAKFQEAAMLALGEADADVSKTLAWLEGEQFNFWQATIRKRQEILAKAEEALRFKRLYKDASGNTPSAVEEIKAVQLAKKNLEYAQQKLVNVKNSVRRLQKEIVLYKGGIGRFANTVSGGVPAAIAQLGGTIEMLEKYIGLGPAPLVGEPAEAGAAAGAGAGAGGMTRATDAAPGQPALDPAALRGAAAPAEAAAGLSPQASAALAGAEVPAEQRQLLAQSQGLEQPPADEDAILIANAAVNASRIFLLRYAQKSPCWYVGSVEAGPTAGYHLVTAAALRAARPDLADILRFPPGTLVALGASGVATVFDEQDRALFPPAAG